MKKIIPTIIQIGCLSPVILMPITSLTSCNNPKSIDVESISLDILEQSIDVNQEFKINATVLPENASDKSVTWTSNNESVATVDQNGNVKGIAKGQTTIVAKANGGKDITCSCTVIVNDSYIPVESIKLSTYRRYLNVNTSFKLNATVLPEDASDKTVAFNSLNPSIASVDNEGNVLAIDKGETDIVVSSVANPQISSKCHINVQDSVVPVDRVTLDKHKVTLKFNEIDKLNATVLPEDATEKSVTWSSSNPSIVGVDQNGNISANAYVGQATISVVSNEDETKRDNCTVTVEAPEPIEGYSYRFNEDKTADIVKYNGSETDIVIPSEVEHEGVTYQVTSIDDEAFSGNLLISNVTINNNINSLGNGVFKACVNLNKVILPDSITSIPDYTFFSCVNLRQVDFSSSITSIETYAFYGCASLENVVLPNNLSKINSSAFEQCTGLKSITFPESLTLIETHALKNCTSLTDESRPKKYGLIYLGTTNQWQKITKATGWKNGTEAKWVKCNDGEIIEP